MNWKEYEGKLLHIRVSSVNSYGPEEDAVSIRVLETNEHVTVKVFAEED